MAGRCDALRIVLSFYVCKCSAYFRSLQTFLTKRWFLSTKLSLCNNYASFIHFVPVYEDNYYAFATTAGQEQLDTDFVINADDRSLNPTASTSIYFHKVSTQFF